MISLDCLYKDPYLNLCLATTIQAENTKYAIGSLNKPCCQIVKHNFAKKRRRHQVLNSGLLTSNAQLSTKDV